MKPAPFEYHIPDSLEQALSLMYHHAGEAKILAGGQSLVPAMNFRVVQPSVLIDLNGVGELGFIREAGGTIRIGAMARERHLEFDSSIAERTPLLHDAVPFIAQPRHDWREHRKRRSRRGITGAHGSIERALESKKCFE